MRQLKMSVMMQPHGNDCTAHFQRGEFSEASSAYERAGDN